MRQQVGAAVGLAVLATLATERSEELLRDGASNPSALTSGYTLAFAIGAGFVIAAIAVAVAVLRSPAPPAEAEERAPRLEPAYREAA